METISRLPDELIDAVVLYLPPDDTVAFGLSNKRHFRITRESLTWRRHCQDGWRFWSQHHDFAHKLLDPPAQTKWRLLFYKRKKTDDVALQVFNQLLETQQYRIARIEQICEYGYDVKDLFTDLLEQTQEDAEDYLSRTYYARVLLGRIHRGIAIQTWQKLDSGAKMELEDVLGAYDLFALSGAHGDLDDMRREFDRVAGLVRSQNPDLAQISTRSKAIRIAQFLREQHLVGNPHVEEYHALRNNFMSMALFAPPHTSLPLQSAAIFCAVARRLGVNARPSNYPHHVIAVVEPPIGESLDGGTRPLVPDDASERERMYMNPWFQSEEADRAHFDEHLRHTGVPVAQRDFYLEPASAFDMVMRAGRNIMHSVQEARNIRFDVDSPNHIPDIDSAWYGMLWAIALLENGSHVPAVARRRQCIPYLFKHYQPYFPEDLGLFERLIMPLFQGEQDYDNLLEFLTAARRGDENKKAPCPRTAATAHVRHRIGRHFRHRRYGYKGVIISWDSRCAAEERWITAMGVRDLPRGREQPFYHVLADDRSTRYVAEENIELITTQPSRSIMHRAGRYFKRWDSDESVFVSNICEEYPDD